MYKNALEWLLDAERAVDNSRLVFKRLWYDKVETEDETVLKLYEVFEQQWEILRQLRDTIGDAIELKK